MDTIDFSKSMRDLYTAKAKVREIVIEPGIFIAEDGKGEPGGTAFRAAIQDVFATTFTLKFALKFGGKLDFKVNRLEFLWLSNPKSTPRDAWEWRAMIRIPDEVSAADVKAAQKQVKERKGIDVSAAKRVALKGGRAVQVQHVGPYDKLCASYEKLLAYASENGLSVMGPAHEIYVNDPCRTAPEKLKTIICLGVAKPKK